MINEEQGKNQKQEGPRRLSSVLRANERHFYTLLEFFRPWAAFLTGQQVTS
jgi:hypothetical protein